MSDTNVDRDLGDMDGIVGFDQFQFDTAELDNLLNLTNPSIAPTTFPSTFNPNFPSTFNSTLDPIPLHDPAQPPPSGSASGSDDAAPAPRKRLRRRRPVNCSFCRRRKLKCDRNQPCANCVKRNIQGKCVYAAEASLGGVPLSQREKQLVPSIPTSIPSSIPSSSSLPASMSSMSTLFNTTVRTIDTTTPNLYGSETLGATRRTSLVSGEFGNKRMDAVDMFFDKRDESMGNGLSEMNLGNFNLPTDINAGSLALPNEMDTGNFNTSADTDTRNMNMGTDIPLGADFSGLYPPSPNPLKKNSMHTRDGKSISNSPISVSSLAPLFHTPSSDSHELKQRLETMERMLVSLVKQSDSSPNSSSPLKDSSPDSNCSQSSAFSDTKQVTKPTQLCALFECPPMPKPDDDLINSLRESLGMLKLDTSGKSVYHGDTHWGSLISEIDDVGHIISKMKVGVMSNSDQGAEKDFKKAAPGKPSSSKPTQGCFAHNSFFATLQSSPNYIKVLEAIPQREQCDTLIERYFAAVNCVFPIVNRAAFDAEYDAFWLDPSATEMSWMALLLGMLCLGLQSYSSNLVAYKLSKAPNKEGINEFHGIASPSSEDCRREPTPTEAKSVFPAPFRDDPERVWNIWLEGAEYCANSWKLNFKPSLTNIRAMLVLMLCQHPSSFDFDWVDQSWIDISTIIRVAQTIGLHRDPQWFALDEYDREERRRLWYLLHYFDTYFTVTQGLPALIRLGTMDVLRPANTNLAEVAQYCRYFDDASEKQGWPIKNWPVTAYTDLSFCLARSKLVLLCNWIYNRTTNLQIPVMPYEQVLAIDSKIRTTYNNAHKCLVESVLQEETQVGISPTTSPGNTSPSVTCTEKHSDQTTLLFERFLYEIEYLKTIITLHRKFSSRGLDNIKYRRSREESISSAERILKLQEWFFRSQEAANVRLQFSYICIKTMSPMIVHCVILLSLYAVGNFDSYSFHATRTLLRRIELSCHICAEVANKTHDPFVSRHLSLMMVLFFEAKAEFEMDPAQRAELKRQREARKTLPKTTRQAQAREQYPGVPTMVNTGYESGYNTFMYEAWEYDRVRQLVNSYMENPQQFYNQWDSRERV